MALKLTPTEMTYYNALIDAVENAWNVVDIAFNALDDELYKNRKAMLHGEIPDDQYDAGREDNLRHFHDNVQDIYSTLKLWDAWYEFDALKKKYDITSDLKPWLYDASPQITAEVAMSQQDIHDN